MEEFNDTDIKIINATFSILQKEGVTKATTKKIAEKAGVNEVTIFRKFKNKNHLVEVTKEYYLKILFNKLEEVFDFNEEDTIEKYLQSNFIGLLNLPDEEFSVFKIAMEEVRDIPEKKQLISRITNVIIDKLDEFFKFKIEKGEIRELDSRVLALVCFSVTFQSVVLLKVYDENPNINPDHYANTFLDILYNGIKV